MTTVKDILDQFNALFRYNKKNVESIDIGDYTFDEAHIDESGYIMEFTRSKNPDVWIRINDDRIAILRIKRISDEEVNVTSWRYGQKHTKNFPYEDWKPFTASERRKLPTKDDT